MFSQKQAGLEVVAPVVEQCFVPSNPITIRNYFVREDASVQNSCSDINFLQS